MRAIKVRVWSPIHEEFWYIGIGDEFRLKVTDIVSQYTGLKDKNGVEIYEGDVVALPYITPLGQITDDYESKKEVITFKNGGFGFQGKTSFKTMQGYIEHKQGEYIGNHGNVVIYGECIMKVIGNIYENPELKENGNG